MSATQAADPGRRHRFNPPTMLPDRTGSDALLAGKYREETHQNRTESASGRHRARICCADMVGVRVLPAARPGIVVAVWFIGALIVRTVIAQQVGVL